MAVPHLGMAPVSGVGLSDDSGAIAAELALRSFFPESQQTLSPDTFETPSDRWVALNDGRTLHLTARMAPPGMLVPSHRGIDGIRMLLSLDDGRPSLILKVHYPDQRLFFDPQTAFDAQSKAAALGCAPALLAFDVPRAASISEYRHDWTTARVSDLKNPDTLEAVIRTKRKIHSGPHFNASWSVFDRIRMLKAACASVAIAAPDSLLELHGPVARIEDMIAAAGVDTVPSHADGIASNILIGPNGRIELVDFDDARNVDPYFEIALLASEVFADEKDYFIALEAFEGQARQASFQRIRLYGIADDFAWVLWGLFMDATSARKDVEFYRYACWRLVRCQSALENTDFDLCARLI